MIEVVWSWLLAGEGTSWGMSFFGDVGSIYCPSIIVVEKAMVKCGLNLHNQPGQDASMCW